MGQLNLRRLLLGAGAAAVLLALVSGALSWRFLTWVPEYRPASGVPETRANAWYDLVAAARGIRWRTAESGRRRRMDPAGMRRMVAANRPALAVIRRALRAELLVPPGVPLPDAYQQAAELRGLGMLLSWEGQLAEAEGRPDRAVRVYLDSFRLGTRLPRGGTLAHAMAAIRFQNRGLHGLFGLVDRLDARTAGAAAVELREMEREAVPLAEILTAEREAGTAALAADLRRADSWSALNGWAQRRGGSPLDAALEGAELALTPRVWILERYRGYLSGLAVDARLPTHQAPAERVPPTDPWTSRYAPAFSLRAWWGTRDAALRVVQARLAVRAFTAAVGRPPARLTELVPAWLPEVPRDPFTGGPLAYSRVGSRVRIYSVGPDGRDDGGVDAGVRAAWGRAGDIASLDGLFRR